MQSLRVEPVLGSEVVVPAGLVALEDVLERAPEAVVDAAGPLAVIGPVHEGEGRAAAVLLPQLGERALGIPAREHLPLEPGMIRFVR